jgi:hypothetical protein
MPSSTQGTQQIDNFTQELSPTDPVNQEQNIPADSNSGFSGREDSKSTHTQASTRISKDSKAGSSSAPSSHTQTKSVISVKPIPTFTAKEAKDLKKRAKEKLKEFGMYKKPAKKGKQVAKSNPTPVTNPTALSGKSQQSVTKQTKTGSKSLKEKSGTKTAASQQAEKSQTQAELIPILPSVSVIPPSKLPIPGQSAPPTTRSKITQAKISSSADKTRIQSSTTSAVPKQAKLKQDSSSKVPPTSQTKTQAAASGSTQKSGSHSQKSTAIKTTAKSVTSAAPSAAPPEPKTTRSGRETKKPDYLSHNYVMPITLDIDSCWTRN